MPNWIEGTMKVRGTAENLVQFLNNAIGPVIVHNYCSNCADYDLTLNAYVEDSRRAFVNEACECTVVLGEKLQTVTIPIRQAWSFTPNDDAAKRWVTLAKKYSVDIRLQGFERGMEFYQDYAIESGEVTIYEVVEYDDWDWECPMPRLGG